ncbi:hypothetical protein CTheo_8238 [Ceratobasidium theobromae]|uniref:HMG box domain-containing protein n=1 Tax=Ceratobasidium theobromae TaxID=1582974 RepID=A0A5N5Q979_9AGAM|nr:hypothetical protein CTheo_8238 [Ceratobasidium theobromae]
MPRAASEKTAKKGEYHAASPQRRIYTNIPADYLLVPVPLLISLATGRPFVACALHHRRRFQLPLPLLLRLRLHIAKPSPAPAGPKKKSSPYNVYMKAELAKLKEKHPDMTHKERFKLAATSWGEAAENPKNQK